MYILASDLLKKNWSFSNQILWLFLLVHQKSLKIRVKNGLLIHNNHLNLCGQEEHSKWILSSRKPGVKFGYLRCLMYKFHLL